MRWIRLTSKRLKNTGFSPENDCCSRVYGLDKKLYPRLSLGIFGDKGIRIGCAIKKTKNHWWDTCDIPHELTNDLIEMIKEYQNIRQVEETKV